MQINWITNEFMTDRFDCEYYDFSTIEIIEKIKNLPHKYLKNFVVNKRSEPPIHSSMYTDKNNGVPIIRFANFDDFEYNLSENVIYINKKFLAEEKIKDFILKPNTVVFGLVGDVGHAFIPGKSIPTALTYRRVAQLELEGIDEYYICTFLNTQYGKKQFDKFTTGVIQRQLRLEDSIEIVIPHFSNSIQSYIGNKVRKAEQLRDEIKLLKKDVQKLFYNYTLLGWENDITKDLTKEYGVFVDPRNVGSLLGAEVYRSDYVENQNKIRSLSSYVNFDDCYEYIVNGVDSRNYTNEQGTAYYKVAAIDMYGIKDRSVDFIEMSIDSINTKQKIEEGDLLITRKGSFGISMGVQARDTEGIISSEVFKVRLKNGWDADYLAYFLNSNYGQKQFLQFATGSTMKGISQQNIVEILIPKIEYYKQQEIGSLVRSIKDMYYQSRELIHQAKNDVESLIEGTFDESIVKKTE